MVEKHQGAGGVFERLQALVVAKACDARRAERRG
jgi:hypothetical protein